MLPILCDLNQHKEEQWEHFLIFMEDVQNMLTIKNTCPLNVFVVNVEMFIFLLESIILICKVCLYIIFC